MATIAFGMVSCVNKNKTDFFSKGMYIPDAEVEIVYGTPSSITQLYQVLSIITKFSCLAMMALKLRHICFIITRKKGVDKKV